MNTFRRVIRIAARREPGGAGEARAVVEDDYHHFRVSIQHDGGRVTSSTTDGNRRPFTLCREAGDRLRELIGMPLPDGVAAVFRQTDARLQCTHQFDIAALAIAFAGRCIGQRRYDVAVPAPSGGCTTARLSRDGLEVLRWQVVGQTIVGPDPFSGRSIGSGFTDWAAKTFAADDAEDALVLRRGVFLSIGRKSDRPPLGHALPTGTCWVHQPERNEQALEIAGSRRDFSDRSHLLTASDEDWIRFA